MKENGELKQGQGGGRGKKKPSSEMKDVYDDVTERFKVSAGMISMARQLLKEAPALFSQVKAGGTHSLTSCENSGFGPLEASRNARRWLERGDRGVGCYRDTPPETLAAFREAMKGKEGGDKRSVKAITVNNVNSETRSAGNSKSYTLSKSQEGSTGSLRASRRPSGFTPERSAAFTWSRSYRPA